MFILRFIVFKYNLGSENTYLYSNIYEESNMSDQEINEMLTAIV